MDMEPCLDSQSHTEDSLPRPASHVGLGSELPPVQPCKDARTPLERAVLPGANASSGSEATASSQSSDRTSSATLSGSSASSSDVFECLRRMQLDEGSHGPERHWGEEERLVRDHLESLHNSSEGYGAQELSMDLTDALGQANPRAIDSDGFALLHHASMHGNTDAVATLLRKRANVHTRTKVHETPLILAAYYRHAEVCALLLAHRARADLADWQGRTALVAAKSSKFGHGRDNSGAAQARCVQLLQERAARDHAAGPPPELEKWRAQGNEFFKKAQFAEATAAYSCGLSFLDDAGLYANRAACHLRLGKHLEAKLDAQKAVGLSGEIGHLKASWRLAKACLSLGELDKAEEAIEQGLSTSAGDAALRQLRNDVILERRKRLGA